MRSWLALLGKELRENALFTWIQIGLLLVWVVVGVLLAPRGGLFFAGGMLFFLFHTLLMPLMLKIAFQREWRTGSAHFWLNIPQSGANLLSTKFVASFLQILCSMILTVIVMFVLFNLDVVQSYQDIPGFKEIFYANIIELVNTFGWIMFLVILYIAAFLSSIILFISVCSKSMRRGGWLIGILVLMVGFWIHGMFTQTAVFSTITQWGPIVSAEKVSDLESKIRENVAQSEIGELSELAHELKVTKSSRTTFDIGELSEIAHELKVEFDSEDIKELENLEFNLSINSEALIYLGEWIWNLGLILLLLYASGWLLDRRVEI